jgi:hypothetical protein
MDRVGVVVGYRHSVLDTESTAQSNSHTRHLSCNPRSWILNQVQDDRRDYFICHSTHNRHSVLDTESTVQSNDTFMVADNILKEQR